MTYKAPFVDNTLFEGIVDSIVTDAVALGYSCVESRYTTGELTYAVIKNPASLNYFGSDWHMALGYVTSSKAFGRVHLFEGWDTTSKMATAYAPGSIGSSAPTNSGTIDAGPSDLSSMFTVSVNSRPMFFLGTVNSGVVNGERYYYSINEDRLVFTVANTLAPTLCFYAGAYERFLPSSLDPVPLCISRWTGVTSHFRSETIAANSAIGAATRDPMQLIGNNENFSAGSPVHLGDAQWLAWTPAGFNALSLSAENDLYSGLPIVSRIPVYGRDDGVRGLFKGVYLVSAAGIAATGTEARWTFAGNTYTATRMTGRDDRVVGGIYMEQL